MSKFLDSAGLVELADAINSTFLRKNTYATSTAAGVIKLGTGLKQTSTNSVTLNLSSQFTFSTKGELTLADGAGASSPISCGLFLGTDANNAMHVRAGAGLKNDGDGNLTLSLGSGFALSSLGTLVFSSNPVELRALAAMLKPYL